MAGKDNSAPRNSRDTPMMRQYLALKTQAGEALMFFRMGDFYELFLEDAEIAAGLLDLVLTTRDRNVPDPVPMCGLPYHAAEGYIRRLLEAGHAVAIAEQVEDPKQAKGLVRREITEVVSPGLVANPDRLQDASANYIAAVLSDGHGFGFAYLDISTGEFAATQSDDRSILLAELDRVAPREVVARDAEKDLPNGLRLRRVPDADFETKIANESTGELPHGLIAGDPSNAARAAAALWLTVGALQPEALNRIQELRTYAAADHMILDGSTRRHLELVQNTRDGTTSGTLLEILDETKTPMGKRELVRRIGEPLLDIAAIRARQDALEEWLEPDSRRREVAQALRGVGDIERIYTRACLSSAGPKELAALRNSLSGLARVHELHALPTDAAGLRVELERILVDEPPPAPRGEPYVGYIRDGVDPDVDRIRRDSAEGRDFLANLETRERERLGIASLKVKYNRVFGYSIEITKANAERAPEDYRRKQTTANAERFTTDELERWEGVVLRAREGAAEAESAVLQGLRQRAAETAGPMRQIAAAVAELDVLQSLAEVARQRDYSRPEIDESPRVEIEGGRHPVVERTVRDGFIPNDLILDTRDCQLIVLTGPNMAGKSTLLRQTGLIVLMAQLGSWVPARRAQIGVADRIFTRVGASDSLTTGESTFMVEMRESAAILSEATPRSLVLLDEIGRGTSTFDGLSIAWAVAEYLHDTPGLHPRALFATHYHELADLARTKPGVRNFHFACEERGQDVLFLRRMEPGAASRSYGIEVARHAGLPRAVIRRARQVLANLEGGEFDEKGTPRIARRPGEGAAAQMGLFEPAAGQSASSVQNDPLRDALSDLEVEKLTPLEALNELDRLKRISTGEP